MPKWADSATASAALLGFRARSALKLLSLSRSHPGLLPRGASVLDLGCSPGAFLQVAAEAVGEKGVVFGIDLVDVDVEGLRRRQRRGASSSSSSSSLAARTAPIFTRVADVLELTPQTLSALFRAAVERQGMLGAEEAAKTNSTPATAATDSPPPSASSAAAPVAVFPFGVVLSDLCHSTLGVRSADAARSMDLATAAAGLALGRAGEGGNFGFGAGSVSEESPEERRGGVLARGGSFLAKVLEGADTPALAAALRPCFESVRWARPPATRKRSTEVYLLCLGRK